MLKVGLIGCGGIGAVHAQCWLTLQDKARLCAIADVDTARAQKFADQCGAKVYTDAFSMLESEALDAVDICVPTFLHADYVIRAMEYVKNIIVEKPICLKEEEAQRLLDAQAKTGALVQVGHVVRFMDPYAYLKKLVHDGTYGKVIAGNFDRISPRPMWMKGHDDINRTGTMALDMHIHDVDYIRYLMEEEPKDIRSWSVKDDSGIVQHIWSSYTFGDTVLTSECSWDYPAGLPFMATFRVRLEKAALVLDPSGVLTVYPEDGEPFVPKLEEKKKMDLGINVSDLGPYLKEITYFAERIEEGRNGIASLDEAVASFRLVWKELELAGIMKKQTPKTCLDNSPVQFAMYSRFSGYVNQHGIEAAARYAKDLGFSGVEFFADAFGVDSDPVSTVEEAKHAKEVLDQYNLSVECYSVYAFLLDRPEQEEFLMKHVELAAALGSPYFHHTLLPGRIPSYEDAVDKVVEAAGRIADYAKTLGITCIYEDQGFYVNGIDGFKVFWDKMKKRSDNVGICGDLGNIQFVNEPAETFLEAYADDIRHVHVKDYLKKTAKESPGRYWIKTQNDIWLRDTMIGSGVVNFEACMKVLKKIGYKGKFALENGHPEPYEEGVKQAMEYLRRFS